MGSDKAIIAGLLGMKPDDLRIPYSFTVAKESGMEFVIDKKEIRGHTRIQHESLWKMMRIKKNGHAGITPLEEEESVSVFWMESR